MKTDKEIFVLNIKIIFLSFLFNPGAIISGLAFYGLSLGKKPFNFISSHDYTNHIFLVIGIVLLLINLYFVLKFEKQKKLLTRSKTKGNQ